MTNAGGTEYSGRFGSGRTTNHVAIIQLDRSPWAVAEGYHAYFAAFAVDS